MGIQALQDHLVTLAKVITKFVHAVKLHVAICDDASEVRRLMFPHVAAAITSTAECFGAAISGAVDARLGRATMNDAPRTRRQSRRVDNVCLSSGSGSDVLEGITRFCHRVCRLSQEGVGLQRQRREDVVTR